jgi:hypothetical protein
MNPEALTVTDTYVPDAIVRDIPRETARLLGEKLVEAGYIRIAGSVATVPRDNPMTVRAMLHEMDGIPAYPRTTHTPEGNSPTVVGPYYATEGGEEFYPVGIGVWQLPQGVPETASS